MSSKADKIGKGGCCQARQPEFEHRISRGRRRGPTPGSFPLTTIYIVGSISPETSCNHSNSGFTWQWL